jgi:hypothetical protein
MAADWWKHGRPRSALSGFPNLDPTKDAQLIDSLYVDQTACDQILDPTRTIEFVHYPNNLFGGLEAKQKAKQDMRAIDGMALRMFLDLRALGKRSIK